MDLIKVRGRFLNFSEDPPFYIKNINALRLRAPLAYIYPPFLATITFLLFFENVLALPLLMSLFLYFLEMSGFESRDLSRSKQVRHQHSHPAIQPPISLQLSHPSPNLT